MSQGAGGTAGTSGSIDTPGTIGGIGWSLLGALARPDLWPIALAGFLARGGIVPFVLPILILPTAAGMATMFGPLVTTLAFAGPSVGFVVLAIVAAVVSTGLIVGGGLIGAMADVTIARAAIDEGDLFDGGRFDVGRPPARSADAEPLDGRLLSRVVAVRLLAHLPLVVVVAASLEPLVAATYHQLIAPGDLRIPIVFRVIGEVPIPVLAIVVAWLGGETVGGLAARFVALESAPVPRALGRALRMIVRAPVRCLATLVATLAGTVVGIGPALIATAVVWDRLRDLLRIEAPIVAVIAATLLLVVVWLTSLVLASILAAWRGVAWTAAWAASSGRGPDDRGRLR